MKLNFLLRPSFAVALLAIATSSLAAQQMMTAPKPDPRVGLRPGTMIRWTKDTTKWIIDKPAGEAAWNMKLLSNSTPSDNFRNQTNSDLAFTGNYVIQGNYNGYQVWDISTPTKPTLATAFFCPASQSDVSVRKHLMFVSSESTTGRLDCGRGEMETVSAHRIRGIRVFDGTDIRNPKYLANVQTCRGSHTHTVVTDPRDNDNVYIYISGTSGVRPEGEVPGCLALPANDVNSACFRVEVIQVPINNPAQAKMITSARIFDNLPGNFKSGSRSAADSADQAAAAAARGNAGRGGGRGGRGRAGGFDTVVSSRGGTVVTAGVDSASGARGGRAGGGGGRAGQCSGGGGNAPDPTRGAPPNQCHDITVYPAIGYAGGACAGLGLLLDIRDPANPKRVGFVADSNFSYWHSATFSNDGSKVLFTDEWGGGGGPKCRASDKLEWGANALFTISNNNMAFKSYYKMPAPQTRFENCVAHNGSLIPIPGREVMVQSWYQGGISIFDWTDINKPFEIAFFDRGPLDTARNQGGGTWSAYWYNGVIVSSEMQRGLDVFELLPSPFITANELAAAKTVKYDELNVQNQPQMVWPPSFALARAFADQLERSKGLSAARLTSVRAELTRAERLTGAARNTALTTLATALHTEANSSSDAPKAHLLATAIGDLGK